MNKIELVDNQITYKQLQKSILFQMNCESVSGVPVIQFTILEDCDLSIRFENCNQSWKVLFIVHPNLSFHFREIQTQNSGKIQYQYHIEENSHVFVEKIHNNAVTKESDIIYLKGQYAQVTQYLKAISHFTQNYEIMIYHQASFTNSSLYNHGIVRDQGALSFHVSSFVSHGNVQCEVNQFNRIMNFTDNLCEIQPNLFIDENDVVANHSAYIGTFHDDELFYLQSRGIPYEEAILLLIQGFLLQGISHDKNREYIISLIEQFRG